MQLLSSDLWLMEPNEMRKFSALAMSSITADIEQVRASAPKVSREKSVGIIPVIGVLEARTSLVGELFGMTSYEKVGALLDMYLQDDSIGSIVFDIFSPGGMVYGAQELANKIYSARGNKPMIAVANHMAASGAFWIGSAADRLVVTPSGDVGSVGVIAEHVDLSRAYDQQGATVTVIRSAKSPYKAESTDMEPLTEAAKQNLQSRIDVIYNKFVSDLAKFRGVSVDHVNQHFGQGRTVDAKDALAAGMVDRIATKQEIVEKLMQGRIRLAAERAQDDWNTLTIRELRQQRAATLLEKVNELAKETI